MAEMASDPAETLIKQLVCKIFAKQPEVAGHAYIFMRSLLLTEPGTGSHVQFNATSSNEQFTFDKRKIQQYLESANPNASSKFLELVDKIQNDRSIIKNRTSVLRFLMHSARKQNSDETILENHSSLKQLNLNHKSSERLNSNSGNETKSSHSSSTVSDLSSSSVIVNGVSEKTKQTHFVSHHKPEAALPCSRVTGNNINLDVGGTLREWDIIEGLLFVWQGIPGKIFRRCATSQKYLLHEKWRVFPWVREIANNLAALGYLHDLLKPYAVAPSDCGLIRHCLSAFVHDRLSRYYATIAAIRTEFQKQTGSDDEEGGLTFMRLRLQTAPIADLFMNMISILEATKEDKGGFLASGVYCFSHHGDPDLQNLVKDILSEICQPLYAMLTKWVLEGSVNDLNREFFIACDNRVGGDQLWLEKYSIRIQMLPEFISEQLAEKVLSVGRSINFLRETCEDEQPYAERQKIKQLFQAHSVDVMHLMQKREELENLIDQAYQETNKRVLDVLLTKYFMLDHFQAHRKFLLLGQGDFIHHLMDLLIRVLDKPAEQLHPHYLNSILESGVRATTAQFEAEDIINRLDAATLAHSVGDTGWDVFYLRYHVDGPIGTVFGPSGEDYRLLFYALWKAKRMETVLSKSWKDQITSAKRLRRLEKLGPVLKQCHELTAEMVHFVRQTQYYFLFEVLECAWNQLVDDVHHAASLDAVINAHADFLVKVKAGVFKDDQHKDLASQLRMVYDLVLELVSQVKELLTAGECEVRERAKRSREDDMVDAKRLDYYKKRRDFEAKLIPRAASKLKILGKTYRDTIKKLLLMLNSADDLSLQLLSVRLDFNEHYKNLDSRLEVPLTFQHRRLSSAGGGELSPILSRKITPTNKLKMSGTKEEKSFTMR